MPADPVKTGMGRRRQGDTEPDRTDESKRSIERALESSPDADSDYERGKEPGARGVATPHRPISPGTRRDIEESAPPERPDE